LSSVRGVCELLLLLDCVRFLLVVVVSWVQFFCVTTLPDKSKPLLIFPGTLSVRFLTEPTNSALFRPAADFFLTLSSFLPSFMVGRIS